MLFALGLNRTSAETPGVTVSGKLVDTISNVQVSNNEGGNLDWELEQWATFRINADFNLTGKNVKKGDTTDITVPDALIITSQSFDIKLLLSLNKSSLMQQWIRIIKRFH